MIELFHMGGTLFMSILTVVFLCMVAWNIYHFVTFFSSFERDKDFTLRKLSYGKSIGLFALVTGILGQLIGLYMAFSAIEKAADISPAIVVGGLKMSMITTFYGIFIYLISILLWLISSQIIDRRK